MKKYKNTHPSCVYRVSYHLVLVTKYRNKVITKEIKEHLHSHFETLLLGKDCNLVEFNGEADHVHLLFDTHPNLNLSEAINSLKTASSRVVRRKFKEHISKYYWKPYFWSRSYCIVSTGGATIDIIKNYIENQGKKP